MAYLNDHYSKLTAGYLFPEIARRVNAFCETNPEAAKKLIRCGIGDVTEALPPAIVEAFHKGVDELATRETFRGYGPEQGYDFLRTAIAKNDFRDHGLDVADDEVFVSDGAKCDTANILDIFGPNNKIAVTDPVYPVYVDTNVMVGHTGPANDAGEYEGLRYLACTEENGFVADLPTEKVDLIYLCFPNNPTGAVASKERLQEWVDYALKNESILLFDAAYESFISEAGIPHSIYEIPGARECAIEFRSFSKNAGFTGTRCAYTVVPKTLMARNAAGEKQSLHPLWARRSSTKFNGVSYPIQRAAEATYSEAGREQIVALIKHYMENAKILREAVSGAGLKVFGGINAPYIWVQAPTRMTSWQMFDRILNEAAIVITPGSGFGSKGEGYFRISAFNSRANAEEAAKRLKDLNW